MSIGHTEFEVKRQQAKQNWTFSQGVLTGLWPKEKVDEEVQKSIRDAYGPRQGEFVEVRLVNILQAILNAGKQ